jgi:hypothetical protein
LCGENLYARHSIAYENLESFFYLFSIWDEHNVCQSWEDTLSWAQLLNLKTPKKHYKGIWNTNLITGLCIDTKSCEGYVVRTTKQFHYQDFDQHVAKWVRKSHITTGTKWMNQAIIPNGLCQDFPSS